MFLCEKKTGFAPSPLPVAVLSPMESPQSRGKIHTVKIATCSLLPTFASSSPHHKISSISLSAIIFTIVYFSSEHMSSGDITSPKTLAITKIVGSSMDIYSKHYRCFLVRLSNTDLTVITKNSEISR